MFGAVLLGILIGAILCALWIWKSRRVSLAFDKRAADRLVYVLVAGYAALFTALSILQHFTFNTAGFDLGIFDQVVWNSLHGRLFENSILPDAPLLISQRFALILLALVPLYAVWSSPLVLLIAQTLGIAFGALPLYWYARREIGRALALVLVAAYFLFPALEFVNLFQFHEIALAIPLLSLATFFLLRERIAPFFITLFAALLVKEDLALIGIAYGLYIAFAQKKWRLGFTLAFASALWTILLLQFIIPSFRGDAYAGAGFYYFGSGIAQGTGRYDYLGKTFLEIIATLATRPDVVAQHVWIPAKLDFMLGLLAPLAFLPLAGAEILLMALPTLGISLLSDYPPQFSIQFHYTAALIPFLFFATARGFRRILNWRHATRRALGGFIVAASLTGYFFSAPGPFAARFEAERYALDAHDLRAYEFLQAIPPRAAVVAQTELAAHLAQRERYYEFPGIPDYRQADYLIGDQTRLWYRVHRGFWDQWLATGYFEIVREQDGYFLARRRGTAPINFHFGDQMTVLGYTLPVTQTMRGGMTIRPIIEWRAEEKIATRYVIQMHLVDARGRVWARDDREPQDGNLPTTQWRVGETIGDQHALALSPAMPPGDYRVAISVCNARAECLDARDAAGENIGTAPTLATIRVEKDKSSVTASQLPIESPFFVDMGELRLLGYAELPKDATPGATLALGVYWRAREKPRGDYEIAVQLRDASDRIIVAESSRPAAGAYPTPQWDAGEVLLDWHDLAIPREMKTGEYKLVVILRTAGDQRELGRAVVTTIQIK